MFLTGNGEHLRARGLQSFHPGSIDMDFTVLLCFRLAGITVVYPGFGEEEGCKWVESPAQSLSHILLRKQAQIPKQPARGHNRKHWWCEASVSTCPELGLEWRSHNFQYFIGVDKTLWILPLPSVHGGEGERALLSSGDALKPCLNLSAGL